MRPPGVLAHQVQLRDQGVPVLAPVIAPPVLAGRHLQGGHGLVTGWEEVGGGGGREEVVARRRWWLGGDGGWEEAGGGRRW